MDNNYYKPCSSCPKRKELEFNSNVCDDCEYFVVLNLLKNILKFQNGCKICTYAQKNNGGYYSCSKNYEYSCGNNFPLNLHAALLEYMDNNE